MLPRTIPAGWGGIRANGEQKAHSSAVEKERGEDCFGLFEPSRPLLLRNLHLEPLGKGQACL